METDFIGLWKLTKMSLIVLTDQIEREGKRIDVTVLADLRALVDRLVTTSGTTQVIEQSSHMDHSPVQQHAQQRHSVSSLPIDETAYRLLIKNCEPQSSDGDGTMRESYSVGHGTGSNIPRSDQPSPVPSNPPSALSHLPVTRSSDPAPTTALSIPVENSAPVSGEHQSKKRPREEADDGEVGGIVARHHYSKEEKMALDAAHNIIVTERRKSKYFRQRFVRSEWVAKLAAQLNRNQSAIVTQFTRRDEELRRRLKAQSPSPSSKQIQTPAQFEAAAAMAALTASTEAKATAVAAAGAAPASSTPIPHPVTAVVTPPQQHTKLHLPSAAETEKEEQRAVSDEEGTVRTLRDDDAEAPEFTEHSSTSPARTIPQVAAAAASAAQTPLTAKEAATTSNSKCGGAFIQCCKLDFVQEAGLDRGPLMVSEAPAKGLLGVCPTDYTMNKID